VLEVMVKVNGEKISHMQIVRTDPKTLMPAGSGTGDYDVLVVTSKALGHGRVEGFERNKGAWALVDEAIKAVGLIRQEEVGT
jgi:hypothetical protein